MNKKLNKQALSINLDPRSKYLRKLIVKSLIGAGRGHVGSAMSIVEILRVLYDRVMKFDAKKNNYEKRDRLILSKGHGCLALYSILADKNFFFQKIFIRCKQNRSSIRRSSRVQKSQRNRSLYRCIRPWNAYCCWHGFGG